MLLTSKGTSRLAASAGLMALLVACGGDEPPAVQPPEVVVESPEIRDVPLYGRFVGTTRATESVEIRARVQGTLQRTFFEPGGRVQTGDTLFLIEPDYYEAMRLEAASSLEAARAESARAESDVQRLEQAIQTNAVSEADLDRARALRDQAVASVAAAEARLSRAELDVQYSRVTTPTSGVVGRSLVDLGNLVGNGQPTLLTTVNKIDPIWVYFDAPERAVLEFLSRAEELSQSLETQESQFLGDLDLMMERLERGEVPLGLVEVATAADEGFPHRGVIDFIDNTVDPATGTIEMRAVIPNSRTRLFPGLFVRVRVSGGMSTDAVLVREDAVGRDLGGAYVLLVDEGNVVERRYVTLGDVQDDGMVVIQEGLEGTERYISEGLLRARPGMPVTPVAPDAGGEG